MAGLSLGNLLGAASNVTTALGKKKNLKSFLRRMDDMGLQPRNNFEVNFSGLEEATFFIQSIDIPGLHQNFTQLSFDGRHVDVPINHEFDHEFNMTVLNDAHGYIYSAIVNFILTDSSNKLANSGYTMTIKALTGNEGKYPGSLITMRGVRFVNVSGLEFGYDNNTIQTFTLSGKLIDYTYTPGALAVPAGVAGTLNSLIGGVN